MKHWNWIGFSLVVVILLTASLQAQEKQITFGFKGISGELKIYEELIEEFQREHPDIKIELIDLTAGGGDWIDRLLVMVLGGTTPDICVMEYQRSLSLIMQGVFRPLDSLIQVDPEFSLDAYIPAAVGAHTYENKVYGIPRDIQPFTLFVNKAELDRAGLPYPDPHWDIFDMRDQARKMTVDLHGDGVIDIWGWRIEDTLTRMAPYFYAFGAEFIDETGTQCLLSEQPAMEAVDFLYDALHNRQAIAPLSSAARFQNGDVGFYLGGPWMVPDFRRIEFPWDIAPVPGGPGGRATTLGSDAYLISQTCPYVDAAWEFVKFCSGPYAQEKMVQLGHVIPSLQELVASPEFQYPVEPPYNITAYNIGFEIAKASPVNLHWENFQKIFQQQMLAIFNGQVEPAQGLRQLTFQANVLFQQ